MSRVLVSFIGVGVHKGKERSGMSKTGYQPVEYVFPDNSKETTTVFGSALIKYLKKDGKNADTWLIMGTPQSIWCDLVEMFGDIKRDEILLSNDGILNLWNNLQSQAINDFEYKTKDSNISQENLAKWQKVLSDNLVNTNVICRLVGEATDLKSQDKIFNSLSEIIKERDEIVFDVTHGLRNQPIITAFVIMYLRYLKKIKIEDITFYYGALDSPEGTTGKVQKLDFCNQIMKATEAVAIYEQTGNYEQIGKNLQLSSNFNEKLEKLSFLDEVNRTDTQIPEQLNAEIEKSKLLPIQQSLYQRFKTPLFWAGKKTLANQLREKANFAFERKQYFKAVLILTEAIVVAYGESLRITDLETYDARKEAEKQLIGEWDYEKKIYIGGMLKNNERKAMLDLKRLRNAIAHGTDPEMQNIQTGVEDEKILRQIFSEGNNLFAKIVKNEIGK